MGLFKRYKGKHTRWYCRFVDGFDRVCKVALFQDKKCSLAMSERIELLASYKKSGLAPSAELNAWITNLPPSFQSKLCNVGLIDPERVAACRPLIEHLADFKETLVNKDRTIKYVNQLSNRILRLLESCRFVYPGDIAAPPLERCLANMRDSGDGVSIQTSNFYLQAIKQFVRFLHENKRIPEHVLQYMRFLNADTDRRRKRRALTDAEAERLFRSLRDRPLIYGMPASDRSHLYWFALETGLRADSGMKCATGIIA